MLLMEVTVTASPKDLTEREALFCRLTAMLCNPREAAIRAGYRRSRADKAVGALLSRADIRERIKALSEETLPELALQGLARLAFGSGTDAAFLALSDEPPGADALDGLDLFSVSEIRRTKGGGCEVKLFDRMKALELLLIHARARESGGLGDFYRALCDCAEQSEPDGPETVNAD